MSNRLCRNIVCVVLVSGVVAGCQTKAQSGALIGGLSGAALGGAIGSESHARAGEGAAIGAVAGVLGGALVGHAMDKQDEKKAKSERYDDYDRAPTSYTYTTDPAKRITNKEVIDWTSRGVKTDVIVDRIERSGQVFHVTAADENTLRDAEVDAAVIRAMKETSRK